MKAKDLAQFLHSKIIGDPDREVSKPGYLHTARQDEISYCYLKDDERDLGAISKSNAAVIICQERLQRKLEKLDIKSTLILSKAPKYDFAIVLQKFFAKETRSISPFSRISSNVEIGRDVDIHPNVVIYDDVKIGDRVTVRANTVLGAEGLDYGKNRKGELQRIPHLSQLIIEDEVDIGSNTTVQRGILRPTILGKGTKIGPNCNIGHEVRIGKCCIITGMTLVAGATEIGDFTFIAPHSTIKNSIRVGKNVFVGIGSLVTDNVPDGTTIVGRPAVEIEEYRKYRRRIGELVNPKPKSL